MFIVSHIFRKLSSRVQTIVSRWRIFCVAVVLAVCIGSLGPMEPVKAQDDDPGEFQFLVDVINPLRSNPMCIGETREYLVRILEKGTINQNVPMENASITLGPGTSISGEVADSSIADITSARTMLINSPSPRLIRPAVVSFTIKAKKAGDTTIKFSGIVQFHSLTIQTFPFSGVPIQVQNCKFKVSAVQQAIVAGGGNFNIVAMIDKAEIKVDEQGHFKGTAPVNWVGASSNVGICRVAIKVADTTQAELTGEMNESGQLAVTLSYQPPQTSTTAVCMGLSNTEPTPLSAEPLKFSVPNTGGVVSLSQGLVFMTSSMPGSAVINVTPEEDQAAAIIPDGYAAGWEDLSNLFGALAALP